MSSSKPAWQYRRSNEGTLHGPYDDEKILSWFGPLSSADEAKDLEFRNIMDGDIAWMPLSEVLARFKTDMSTVHSDSSSQDDAGSALTSHCGSFTPPSSDERGASQSLIPTPSDNQSLILTAPPSPERRHSKMISSQDAFDVTLGRVADKVTYRMDGRGTQHYKNVVKNYTCWCLMPETSGQSEFAWGPLKLEEILLATYEAAVVPETLLAVVDASVPDYVMHPSTDILKMIAMPFHEHVTAHKQRSPITWSIRQIEEFVGSAAVQHTSTVNSELLDTIPRGQVGRMLHHIHSHGLPSDSTDWPGAHLEANFHMRQRPNSCSQIPPMSVLQHQQSRQHGSFPRAHDDMSLPQHATRSHQPSVPSRACSDPRAPVFHGFDNWQGKKYIVDEVTRARITNTMIKMVQESDIPPVDCKLPPALANPPPPNQNMHRQMASLTMPIPEHCSHHMQQMPIPTSSTRHSINRPISSAPNSFSNDELLAFTCAPTRSRHNSRPSSYSQVPQEFNIHAADFTPVSTPDMPSTMDSHVQSNMDRIASSFSGQLDMKGNSVSAHGSLSQGLFTHSDAAPMRQTDPGAMNAHNMLPSDPATVATAAAAVLNPDQLNSVLTQMASKMNCPTEHMQDLLNSLTQASRLQFTNPDTQSPPGSGNLPDVSQAVASQPMAGQTAVSVSMSQWPSANDSSHLIGGQPLNPSVSQPLQHQSLLPPHLQAFNSDFPRQHSVPGQSLVGGSGGLGSFSGFGSGHLGSFGAGMSGGLGSGSGGGLGSGTFGSGNLGGSLGDPLGRSHNFGRSGGFNDSLQCIDLGLGQM